MVRKTFICALGLILSAAAGRVCAQEAAAPAESNSTDIQWVWGEVTSVDPAAKSLSVKYLDYDTDEEKTMNMTVSDTTTFQEVKSLEGIKAQDTVSIEYAAKEGKNYAKDITVEKVEDAADAGNEQMQQVPPEKVGSGPAGEASAPQDREQPGK
jgi:Cu/Ag efflux protein CusF